MSLDAPKKRGNAQPPAEASSQSLRSMLRLASALFALALVFGGLPQSDAVRERLVRSGLVSSGRPDREATVAATTTVPPPVEASQVIEVLASSGYPEVDADVLDRVVTLTGTIPDDASRRVIAGLVRAEPGVADVVDHTVVAVPGTTGDVTVSGTTSRVVLAGSVPDAVTADAILAAVQEVYVADQVGGAVTVDPDLPTPALVAIAVESTRPELGDRLAEAFDSIDPALVKIDLRFRQLEIPPLEHELADVLATEPIEFAVGSSRVEEASQPTLDELAAVLEQFPRAVIEVGGHTDDTGSDRSNRQLSAERAGVVVAELEDRGVASELRAVGYGSTRPRVVPFDNEPARAANRRIEFVLVTP